MTSKGINTPQNKAVQDDAFETVRTNQTIPLNIEGEPILMLLNWRDVRMAAKDWQTFSSDAPMRVPIPSEEHVRSVRQLPIEADPPMHTEIRQQLGPWFRRPSHPAYVSQLDKLIAEQIKNAKQRGQLDLVRDFALPLQSKTLALLLAMPLEAAETWIAWGTHVFRDGDDPAAKGQALDAYIRAELARAKDRPGNDFFSALWSMKLGDLPLSESEMIGVANLVFAGGRDTVITMITMLLVMFAERRSDLEVISRDLAQTHLAVEELLRAVSPLTHIGRVCPHGAAVGSNTVAPGKRVSLCWAAANYDPAVFDTPGEVDFARSPNPHVAFGIGRHNCLGASQARAILRRLIVQLSEHTDAIHILDAKPQFEDFGALQRQVGFSSVTSLVR